jgi:ABC-2 type transport system ATP-binding protein
MTSNVPDVNARAVQCDDLGRTYKIRGARRGDTGAREIVALDAVTLDIERGELFGLLGPNGAGKTTLIKILATLLLPTRGTARVLGYDVVDQTKVIRGQISMVSGGETSGYGLLTVEENLWMFARFYGLESSVARHRIAELLEIVGIADRARSKVSDLSTGLRQKMNFVRGFISDPTVVFLDEPTLGLDVTAARHVRDYVRQWLREHPDRTILLTTHYMAEADELCNRLAIIDRGRLLALDSPWALKQALRREVVFTLKVAPLGPPPARDDMVESVSGVRQVTVADREGYTELQLILASEERLTGVLDHIASRGSSLIALEKREATLEDVFIDLVGRGLDVDTGHKSDTEAGA